MELLLYRAAECHRCDGRKGDRCAMAILNSRVAALLLLTAVFFTACGGIGGGSSTSPPPPPANFTIWGSISGLSGTGLVLQNNGGNNLSMSANGSFTFG